MDHAPAPARRGVRTLMSLLAIGFFAVCAFYGRQSISVVALQRSPALQISMAWVYSALPAGSLLMLLHLIDQMLSAEATKDGTPTSIE
jgi:TRAP-type C4-dicarboxylate transport system permease small subunit